MLELNGPVIVSLEITKKCGYGNCPGCPRGFNVPEDELTISQWDSMISKLDVYVQEYRISGGEPTEHPHFLDILKILEKTGKFYHIFSNGQWQDTDRILEGLINCAHVSSVTFSLHGHDSSSHNAFCGAAGSESFEKLLENIRMAYAAGFNVNTNTVLTCKNIEHIEEIADLAVELGAKNSIFSRYIGPVKPEIEITSEQLEEACKTVDELKGLGYNVVIGNCIPHCLYPADAAGCYAGITYASVDWQGNLKPCSFSSVTAGNLLKSEVKTIWRSKEIKKWRTKIAESCRKCTKLSVCPSGCKAYAEFNKIDFDPLIGEPVKKPEHPPVLEVTLEEELCPIPRYVLRKEDFGWILIHGNQVVPVSQRAEKIIKSLDGTVTLGEIEKKFGSGALSFIYSLYVRDFIEFRVRNTEEEKV